LEKWKSGSIGPNPDRQIPPATSTRKTRLLIVARYNAMDLSML
jgi:hypothetical protein